MNCEEMKNKLSLLIDNELFDKERKLVEEHISLCSACQKELKILLSINKIAKVETFEERGTDYWKELTGNIMDKIRPTEKPQPFWRGLLDKIEDLIFPGRINYRFVGLAAVTVILIFFVKISFFNQGKFNLPMEMEKIEAIINEQETEETNEQFEDVEDERNVLEKEKIVSEPAAAKRSIKKGIQKKSSKVVDGVRLGSGTKEKSNQMIFSKSNRVTAPTNSDADLKELFANIEKDVAKEKAEKVVEREVSSLNLVDEDKSHRVEKSLQKMPLENKLHKQSEMKPLGGVESHQEETLQTDMAIQPPSVPNDSKFKTQTTNGKKTRAFKYRPTASLTNNSISKDDPFVIILEELDFNNKSEDKVRLLKNYLEQYPKAVHKNQATCLLAENLIQLSKETNNESNIQEAVAYFQKNETVLKKFDNYKMLKNEIKKLKKKK
jgi:hypothetical protein